MNIITLDFETYYAKDYGLKKLTYEEYIADARFEVIGVAVQVNDGEPEWFSGNKEDTYNWLTQFDLENNAVLMHNSMFDASILAFHFDIYPKIILDTLCMARALHGAIVGGSLKALAQYYDVGEKGEEVHNFIGYTRSMFTPEELESYANYCKKDAQLTYYIYTRMAPYFNKTELKLIDMTIRMYTEPKFMYDREFLVAHLKDVQQRQQKLLDDLNLTHKDLRSNLIFADLLRAEEVEPPTKISATTGRETYALAKTDEGMKALLEHENVRVQQLAAARLGVKSSLEETRTQRLIDTGDRNYYYLPIGLNYYGARTGRWSATQGLQFQNLPNKSDIKQGVIAPPGYVIVGADLSNIELRVGLWFAGQMDKLKLLQDGLDLYKDFASKVFNVPYDEVNKDQRFIGKTCIAEGELVLTDKGLKPIETILLDDKVWDGVEWVNHDGLIYQGEKDVITYQGLTATPDHIVYLSDGSTCEFQEAADKSYQIAFSGYDGKEVQFVGDCIAGRVQEREEENSAHTSEMPLRERSMANSRQFNVGQKQAVSQLRIGTSPRASASFIGDRQADAKTAETGERYVSTVYQPKRQSLHTLWRTWYSVRFWVDSRMCKLYEDSTKMLDIFIGRQDRQQWELQCWEPAFCYPKDANEQQAQYRINKLDGQHYSGIRMEAEPIPSIVFSEQICAAGYDRRTDSRKSLALCTQQVQGMGQVKREIRKVYDIANAGPRHRFTVNNLLVSNCSLSLIYGTGHTKLRNAIKQGSGTDIGQDEAKRIVELYREEYGNVAAAWRAGSNVLSALYNGYIVDFGHNNLCRAEGTGIVLPSGLMLSYPNLRQEFNGDKMEWRYDKSTREVDRVYGAKVFQGTVQALARCVIGEAMVRIHNVYPLGLTLHDAVYLTVKDYQADEALKFVETEMCRAPVWLPEIILGVEGHIGKSLKEV